MRDLQVLGVRRWRELVADRKTGKDIVRQAKAHSGLLWQWKKKKKKKLNNPRIKERLLLSRPVCFMWDVQYTVCTVVHIQEQLVAAAPVCCVYV